MAPFPGGDAGQEPATGGSETLEDNCSAVVLLANAELLDPGCLALGLRKMVFLGLGFLAPLPCPVDWSNMADFRTHITVSTIAGALFGVGGYQSGMPWESCVIAGGLCSVSGMLPDLDSDSGIPLREAVAFSSAFIPMLMVDRLSRVGLSHEMMLVVTGGIYLFLRFGIAEFFRRYTVHRGMWHSIPAALIAAIFVFLVSSSENVNLRLFKTIAVFIGFMSHILLDELWSVEYRRGRYTFKHTFGTALKWWGPMRISNIMTYGLLILVGVLAYHDEGLMERFGYAHTHDIPHTALDWLKQVRDHSQNWIR
jgi:membrane-bound metal-dependent hydrolase YbcI (DUF457 family)